MDLEFAIAFKAARQTLGDFAKFQGPILMAISYQSASRQLPMADR